MKRRWVAARRCVLSAMAGFALACGDGLRDHAYLGEPARTVTVEPVLSGALWAANAASLAVAWQVRTTEADDKEYALDEVSTSRAASEALTIRLYEPRSADALHTDPRWPGSLALGWLVALRPSARPARYVHAARSFREVPGPDGTVLVLETWCADPELACFARTRRCTSARDPMARFCQLQAAQGDAARNHVPWWYASAVAATHAVLFVSEAQPEGSFLASKLNRSRAIPKGVHLVRLRGDPAALDPVGAPCASRALAAVVARYNVKHGTQYPDFAALQAALAMGDPELRADALAMLEQQLAIEVGEQGCSAVDATRGLLYVEDAASAPRLVFHDALSQQEADVEPSLPFFE